MDSNAFLNFLGVVRTEARTGMQISHPLAVIKQTN